MLEEGKKIYFASDFHLGIPDAQKSRERERRIIAWLDEVKQDAQIIFLVGDIFDFWFEYKHVIPKGFIRFLGKLSELVDAGIDIRFFIGNHDMWMFDYFERELDITIYRTEQKFSWNGKKFFVGHGDGLGPGDKGYKFIKRVFRSKVSQWLFARLHPNFGVGMANFWSKKSRDHETESMEFMGEDKEWLISYCKEQLETEHYDYLIFGHRHLPIDFKLKNGARYINLGEWINHNSYAVFDGDSIELLYFQQ